MEENIILIYVILRLRQIHNGSHSFPNFFKSCLGSSGGWAPSWSNWSVCPLIPCCIWLWILSLPFHSGIKDWENTPSHVSRNWSGPSFPANPIHISPGQHSQWLTHCQYYVLKDPIPIPLSLSLVPEMEFKRTQASVFLGFLPEAPLKMYNFSLWGASPTSCCSNEGLSAVPTCHKCLKEPKWQRLLLFLLLCYRFKVFLFLFLRTSSILQQFWVLSKFHEVLNF